MGEKPPAPAPAPQVPEAVGAAWERKVEPPGTRKTPPEASQAGFQRVAWPRRGCCGDTKGSMLLQVQEGVPLLVPGRPVELLRRTMRKARVTHTGRFLIRKLFYCTCLFFPKTHDDLTRISFMQMYMYFSASNVTKGTKGTAFPRVNYKKEDNLIPTRP